MFVNCQVRGWVTEKPCLKWTLALAMETERNRQRFARLIAAGAGSRGLRILLKWMFG